MALGDEERISLAERLSCMKFFVHEKAFQECLAAADGYEEREDSLRNDFVFEIEHMIAALTSDPKRCAFAAKTFVIARVHRFPDFYNVTKIL